MASFEQVNSDLMTDIAEAVIAGFDGTDDWRKIQYEKFWDAPGTASTTTDVTFGDGSVKAVFAPEDADDMVDELHDQAQAETAFDRVVLTVERESATADVSFNFKFSRTGT